MNKADVQERILKIIGFLGDYEIVHDRHDELMEDFITAIRDGNIDGDAKEMASMILDVMEVDGFGRWYS